MLNKLQILTIAIACHNANKAYCESMGDDTQLPWDEAPQWQKDSAIKGVEYHLANPKSTPADSHNSWLKEKTEQGWMYGPMKNLSVFLSCAAQKLMKKM